jgi:putative spermidine/putrescine transport system ATP-binding protein
MTREVPDLELEAVSKRYGDASVVRDVSFQVRRGEFVTLLGPSGGGKTSTLRMIAGFVRPDAGQIRLRGERVNEVPPYERDIGMVFQNYALFPHMTVRDNVAFGLEMRRRERGAIVTRVGEMLALVRLQDYAARYPHQLSGGQQQRVAIARALVIEPSLLLLDEPMSNLDAALRASMQWELRQIVERVGVTTLYVTHNQEEALSMSDRIIVMSSGRIEQIGSPLEVYAVPANEFVAGFLGRSNVIPCRVLERAGELITAKMESGDTITARAREASPGEMVRLLIRPESISIRPPGQSGPNCVQGRVSQVAFMGAFAEYVVDAGGTALLVQEPLGDARGLRRPGERVTLAWDPGRAVALGGAPAGSGR